jgi:hypothetical protein
MLTRKETCGPELPAAVVTCPLLTVTAGLPGFVHPAPSLNSLHTEPLDSLSLQSHGFGMRLHMHDAPTPRHQYPPMDRHL